MDNLDVLRGLNRNIADAIITDPPFCSNQFYEHCFGTDPKDRKGKTKPGFDDAWTLDDVRAEEHQLIHDKHPEIYHLCALARQTHSAGMQAYLIMMATRLLLCHEILKDTGSMYLHCDHHANSYLRLLMDIIFGEENFRNEIIWKRQTNSGAKAKSKRKFGAMHDTILFYGKSERTKINQLYLPVDDAYIKRNFSMQDKRGRFKTEEIQEASQAKLEEYERDGLLHKTKTGRLRKKKYEWQFPGELIGSLWTDFMALGSNSKERTGFKTQKPVALYSRMILASTNPGDLVIDPFCGCATTIVAAENAGRQWIGIDRDPVALDMIYQQLGKLNENSLEFWRRPGNIIPRKRPPTRTDQGKLPHYRTHKKTLYEIQDRKCAGCDYPKAYHGLDVDHDVPVSKGGGDEIDNLNLLCPRCNRRKGTGTLAQLRAKLKREFLLYHQQEEGYVLPTRQKIKKPKRISKKQTALKWKTDNGEKNQKR